MMMQDAGREVGTLGSQILQGSSDLKDLNAAQRLVQAATNPLILLARHTASLLVSSTYSSTALALNGGLGAVRILLGVFQPASVSLSDSTCPEDISLLFFYANHGQMQLQQNGLSTSLKIDNLLPAYMSHSNSFCLAFLAQT